MLSLGIDIGTSTVKLVLLKNQEIEKQWMAVHHGNPFVCLKKGLSTLELAMDTPFSLCVTGSNTEALLEQDSAIPSLGDIPAIVEGVRWIIPQVGSVIEIGSQGARFITDLQSRAPQFSVNEHCAGGTGSFFEDQMSRVGCRLGDYSSLVEQAQSVPRLSGRCAVFAKTDIIHRQQEGVSTPDILLGLCYAMIRNYKVTIVRRLPICKPVVFCGGVTCNAGVIRAIRDIFGLSEKELIVPEFARYEAALGAALKASVLCWTAEKSRMLNLSAQCWKHCPKWRRIVTHSSAHCWREISSMLLRQINVQTFRHSGMLCPAGSSCTQRRERSAHFSPKAAALPLLVRRSA